MNTGLPISFRLVSLIGLAFSAPDYRFVRVDLNRGDVVMAAEQMSYDGSCLNFFSRRSNHVVDEHARSAYRRFPRE